MPIKPSPLPDQDPRSPVEAGLLFLYTLFKAIIKISIAVPIDQTSALYQAIADGYQEVGFVELQGSSDSAYVKYPSQQREGL